MISNMEKFIKFKQLRVVRINTADAPTGVQLKDGSASFTTQVLPNAIVWDRSTNSTNGGEMYIVDTVTSDTELALTAIGPNAATSVGVPDGATYNIYMPEYTVRQAGTADGTGAFQLIDTTANFIAAGVKIGDYALDITAAVTAKVTAVTPTTLTVDTDTFVGGDTYLVYASGADDLDTIMRSADVALVEVDPSTYTATGNNSAVDLIYNPNPASHARVTYVYSDTVGGIAAPNEDMRNALQDAVVASLETPWSEVVYDFPGLLNPASATNTTWLAGRNYFILAVAINLP